MTDTPRHYPVFIDLRGRLAVVIGGGEEAERRARSLVKHGADVAVVSSAPTAGLDAMEAESRLTIERRDYVAGDLRGAFVVICASGSAEVDAAAAREAEAQGSLVAVVDAPRQSNFVVPSVVRRGALQIAVSTAGTAPALARRLRREIAEAYGPEWGEYVELQRIVREIVLDRVPASDRRERMLEALASDDTLRERLVAGEDVDPEAVFKQLVMEHHD